MPGATFIKSATRKDHYPNTNLPRIAFVGRSNVGKSSLINCLVGRKRLARTSSTPGRTQVINFYRVDDQYIFVDLPGYGFARAPAHVRARWGPMIEQFLSEDRKLRLAIVIVDSRNMPSELDQIMIGWLNSYQIPFKVVATKIDKISRNARRQSVTRIEESLGVQSILMFSASKGIGVGEVWGCIREHASA